MRFLSTLLIFCTIWFSQINSMQAQGCGTKVTPAQRAIMDQSQPLMRSFNSFITRGIIDIPIQAHVVTRTDGTGGITVEKLQESIDDLNSYYINANIRFVILEDVNYINNDNHFNFNVDNEEMLGRLHDVKNVINLYVTNTISSGMYSLCGYAYFPPGNDRIVMSKYCVNNGSTMPHEFGHYFMLYHTHGPSNNGSTDELVDGSNCTTAGDRICDTSADPNLSGKIDEECNYTGTGRDKNGDFYKPDPNNMMSYSSKTCRKHFSKDQYKRINWAALNKRSYLKFPPKPELIVSTKKKDEAKLSGQLVLEVSGQNVDTELDKNLYRAADEYYSGTNFQLYISNHESAYVYVIGSNLTKENSLLFPIDNQSAFLPKGRQRFALPGNNYMYQLDDVRGKDYFCVLYSKKPININKIMKKMEYSDGTFMQRLYKALGNDVVPLNQIQYANNKGNLEFSALAHNKTIVPIVVEMPHL